MVAGLTSDELWSAVRFSDTFSIPYRRRRTRDVSTRDVALPKVRLIASYSFGNPAHTIDSSAVDVAQPSEPDRDSMVPPPSPRLGSSLTLEPIATPSITVASPRLSTGPRFESLGAPEDEVDIEELARDQALL